MSLLENKIDVYRLISLQGQMIPPAQTKVTMDRNGVDGSEFIMTGRKGQPFSVISQVDEVSYEECFHTFAAYQRLIDGDAVEVVQGGVSTDDLGYRCVVLGVELISIVPLAGAVGNFLNPPSQGFLIARWDLMAVPT